MCTLAARQIVVMEADNTHVSRLLLFKTEPTLVTFGLRDSAREVWPDCSSNPAGISYIVISCTLNRKRMTAEGERECVPIPKSEIASPL